jgi:esterase/lipase
MSHIWQLLKSLSVAQQLDERHRPSGVDARFHRDANTPQAYVAAGRQHVERCRTDLDHPQREWIIDGNSPFLLQPETPGGRRRAILMVHGLTDAPFLVRDIATFFQARGFSVLGMLLPGHGTRPGDLREIRWQHWVQAHEHLLDLLRAQADEIHLLGFSAGATLNLYQALRHDDIRALYLFSPALRVRSLAALSGPLAWLGRWSRRLAWFDVQPDTDSFKYESLANRGIWEVCKMIRACERLGGLKALDVPVFAAASANDVTIDTPAILDWFGALGATPRRLLWYSTRQTAVPPHVRLVPAAHPDLNISSYAHTSLLSSPSNPHYGAEGSQRFCTHYYRLDPAKYQRCKAGEEDCLGEMFHETPDCQVLRRLTYNPLFEDMLTEIQRFLEALDGQAGNAGQA